MYKHLLIATDGSELAQKAVDQGVTLAKALGAKVTIVTASEPWHAYAPGEAAMSFPVKEYQEAAQKRSSKVLADAEKVANDAGVACETIYVTDTYPAEGILTTADKVNCDLIVMASHGRRGISKLLLGSQANNVVTHSERPVLICR